MRMRMRTWLPGLFLLAWCTTVPAIPPAIHVNGRLLDAKGDPVYYWDNTLTPPQQIRAILQTKLVFYDSSTGTVPFAIVVTTCSAYNSYFDIGVRLPEAALVKDQLWYNLAIDADRNGLTWRDDFPDRFEIGSVPFAVNARPLTSFSTFGGWKGGATQYHLYQNVLMVVPFDTPPGGVEFNQMNIYVFELDANAAFAFGLYDEKGTMVTSSGLIGTKTAISQAFLQIKAPYTKLQPSKTYYIGFARNSGMVMMLQGLKPVAPVLGTVATPYTDGRIPKSFDPDKIDPNIEVLCLPVTLCLMDDKVTSGWVSKPGGAPYRWIQGKQTKGAVSRYVETP